VSDETKPDPLAILAATMEGDRWLSAEASAFLLGQLPMSTFYQIAAKPDFPPSAKIGKARKWRRLALLNWPDKAA
jgi:predicted DNA-binding transcriptional regulator AlpA